MTTIFICVGLALLGAAMGSFAGAQVWRLRARQDNHALDADFDKKTSKKLKKSLTKNLKQDRSVCLHCQHPLEWYDLIPVLSWLSLRGKCRYCKSKIGRTEILLELGMGAVFVFSFVLWPVQIVGILEVIRFIIWLVALVMLAIMFVYDLRWYLLPDKVNIPFIILGAAFAALSLIGADDVVGSLLSLVAGGLILSGLYLVLYIFSKGAWVGFGDVKLTLGMALFLADWRLAFMALFSANLFGTIIVLPGMISGKMKRQTKIPFGPLLIAGFVFSWFFGANLINSYLEMIFL